MNDIDFESLDENAGSIVDRIEQESVDVYLFLSDELRRGPITDNHVFQFVCRSFYRLDNAGLTPAFKSAYFRLLEGTRDSREIDLKSLASTLHGIPTQRGHNSLQFSFVTKLANTVCSDYPIYDAQVAGVFRFRAPYNNKPFDTRLQKYLDFYAELREQYQEILSHNLLERPVQLFRTKYAPASNRVPPIKILDFIFWSAGKLSGEGQEDS